MRAQWEKKLYSTERACVRLFALAFVIFVVASCGRMESADAAAKLRVGILQFGTLSWVLDTIQHNGLDKAEGIELEVVPLASTQATKVGLQNGSLNLIATDWLWVTRERSLGADFTFSPFSTELGPHHTGTAPLICHSLSDCGS
jgi:NitT/TauT family transport system substrate-binding protein